MVRVISARPFDPRVTLEKMLKPLEAYQQRRDQALAALRVLPEEQETRFCWGGPGQFTLDDIPADVGVTVKIKDEKDDPEEEKKVLTWNESGRAFKKIRVENPDDPEQYVIITRIEDIDFKPPQEDIKEWTKHIHRFKLNHPQTRRKNPPR
jgi:hypothetical protein